MSFAAGDLTKTISVTINGDTTVEPNETFFVNLSNATNGGTIVKSQGTRHHHQRRQRRSVGNISINDVTIAEGNAGTSIATFTVTRTGGTAAFDVNYATADGTATARQRLRRAADRHGELCRRRSHQDRFGDHQRRHDRRAQRDVLRQPVERDQRRHHRQSQGTGTITNDDTAGGMKVPQFNQKFGTDAGEDLIGTACVISSMALAATIGSTARAAMTSSMAGPETTCWTVERAPTSCMGAWRRSLSGRQSCRRRERADRPGRRRRWHRYGGEHDHLRVAYVHREADSEGDGGDQRDRQ